MAILKPKIVAIDCMRTLSILAVLLIHTTTRVLEAGYYNLNLFSTTLFLNQISRFAVPLFIFISGFLLEVNNSMELNYLSYLKKRFTKILIPYIFWSLIYYFFVYTNNSENLLMVFLKGNASYQLYFIPTICIFYLLFPLLHKMYKFIANIPVLAGLIYFQILLMNKDYLVRQFTLPDPLRIFILGYIFFLAGMVAAKNKDLITGIAGRLRILLIPLLMYLGYFIFSEGKSRYFLTYDIKAFYSQWRPDILLYTLTIAAVSLYYFNRKSKIADFFAKLSRYSFFVFFIHVIILEGVWKTVAGELFMRMPKFVVSTVLFDALFFVTVGGLSFLIAYLIHKIPTVSKLTG